MRKNYPSLMGSKSAKKAPVLKPRPAETRIVKAKTPQSDGAKYKASTGSMSMKKMFMDGCKGA